MAMSLARFINTGKIVVIQIALLFIAGCSVSPKEQERTAVFYPPLPNPPRIQHLLSITTFDDLNQTKSSFADFVLGSKSKEDLVKKPYGIALFENKVHVVDSARAGYVVLDLVTRKRKFINGGAAGRMSKPINITIDKDGTKYISDTGRQQVLQFDKNDNFIRAYGKKGQFRPSDVAILDKKIFVTDLKGHRVLVLDKLLGHTVGEIGKVGSKQGELYFPTNLAISPDKHLYVTDTGNFRVQKYTLDGYFVKQYGSIGSGLGKFARPKGISLDREGRLYVVDAAFENIQVIDNTGKLLLFFGKPGDDPADINLPADISIDYESVSFFQAYAEPKFKLEYVLLVSSQFGVNKINVFGFGRMEGMEYSNSDKK